MGSSPLPYTPATYTNTRNTDGSYSFGLVKNKNINDFMYYRFLFFFSYSTSNGMSRSEVGSLTPTGYQVKGSYHYRGPDGVKYTVEFVADQNGYRPMWELNKMKLEY